MATTTRVKPRKTKATSQPLTRKAQAKSRNAKAAARPNPRKKREARVPTAVTPDDGPKLGHTKQQACINLLKRPTGATVDELQIKTAWQRHSVRGFLSGTIKKKLGFDLVSENPDNGPRRYRIAEKTDGA